MIDIDFQIATQAPAPDLSDFQGWLAKTYPHIQQQIPDAVTTLCVRLVEKTESAALNTQFRKKAGPTNILSFAYRDDEPDDVPEEEDSLGDLVICADVVNAEAQAQNKSVNAHWAHIFIHGILHLLGYDHIKEEDAHIMESLETKILAELGFEDPYTIEE